MKRRWAGISCHFCRTRGEGDGVDKSPAAAAAAAADPLLRRVRPILPMCWSFSEKLLVVVVSAVEAEAEAAEFRE